MGPDSRRRIICSSLGQSMPGMRNSVRISAPPMADLSAGDGEAFASAAPRHSQEQVFSTLIGIDSEMVTTPWRLGSRTGQCIVGSPAGERAAEGGPVPGMRCCGSERKTPTRSAGVYSRFHWRDPCEELVRLAGIEPTTLGFGGQYSIH